jgi:hypothetical protein
MPYAGVPDASQMIGAFARNHDEPLRFSIKKRKTLRPVSIDHDYSVQSQVRLFNQVHAMGSVAEQQVAQRVGVFAISEDHLDRFHLQPAFRLGSMQSRNQYLLWSRSFVFIMA